MSPELHAAAADARVELLSRLEHFALQPRTVLDLGAAVSATDATVLQRRFPQARIILSRSTPDSGVAAVADDSTAQNIVSRLQQWWWRVLEQGVQRLAARAGTARLKRIVAAPTALPLAEGSVDLVLGQWLMPGEDNLDAVLVEIRRCLAPGGLFLWTSAGPVNGESPVPGAIDMHDLGSALTRAGFHEPVLDVDRYPAAHCEVIHAAAFAGEAGRAVAGEVVVPVDSLRRRRTPS